MKKLAKILLLVIILNQLTLGFSEEGIPVTISTDTTSTTSISGSIVSVTATSHNQLNGTASQIDNTVNFDYEAVPNATLTFQNSSTNEKGNMNSTTYQTYQSLTKTPSSINWGTWATPNYELLNIYHDSYNEDCFMTIIAKNGSHTNFLYFRDMTINEYVGAYFYINATNYIEFDFLPIDGCFVYMLLRTPVGFNAYFKIVYSNQFWGVVNGGAENLFNLTQFEWNHIALTMNETGVTYYLNNELAGFYPLYDSTFYSDKSYLQLYTSTVQADTEFAMDSISNVNTTYIRENTNATIGIGNTPGLEITQQSAYEINYPKAGSGSGYETDYPKVNVKMVTNASTAIVLSLDHYVDFNFNDYYQLQPEYAVILNLQNNSLRLVNMDDITFRGGHWPPSKIPIDHQSNIAGTVKGQTFILGLYIWENQTVQAHFENYANTIDLFVDESYNWLGTYNATESVRIFHNDIYSLSKSIIFAIDSSVKLPIPNNLYEEFTGQIDPYFNITRINTDLDISNATYSYSSFDYHTTIDTLIESVDNINESYGIYIDTAYDYNRSIQYPTIGKILTPTPNELSRYIVQTNHSNDFLSDNRFHILYINATVGWTVLIDSLNITIYENHKVRITTPFTTATAVATWNSEPIRIAYWTNPTTGYLYALMQYAGAYIATYINDYRELQPEIIIETNTYYKTNDTLMFSGISNRPLNYISTAVELAIDDSGVHWFPGQQSELENLMLMRDRIPIYSLTLVLTETLTIGIPSAYSEDYEISSITIPVVSWESNSSFQYDKGFIPFAYNEERNAGNQSNYEINSSSTSLFSQYLANKPHLTTTITIYGSMDNPYAVNVYFTTIYHIEITIIIKSANLVDIGIGLLVPIILIGIFPFAFSRIWGKKGVGIGLLLSAIIITLTKTVDLGIGILVGAIATIITIISFKKDKDQEEQT